MKRSFKMKKVLAVIGIAVLAIIVLSSAVMLLWNHVLVDVVNVHAISFGQAAGILVLSKILFGGFRGGGWRHRGGPWNKELRDKWQNMTPEERDRLREKLRGRFGRWQEEEAGA